MVTQYFDIGNRDWHVVVYYDVWPHDLHKIEEGLYRAGNSIGNTEDAIAELSILDTGYTFTNFGEHMTVIVISHATSPEQMFDTIIHEIKHLVEHVSSYYGLDPKEELSAYLQGEVGRQMFPAVVMVACPKCNREYRSNTRIV